MQIIRFYVMHHVYMAEFIVNGEAHTGAVWRQGCTYYVNTGAARTRDLQRHELSPEQVAQYIRFIGRESQ